MKNTEILDISIRRVAVGMMNMSDNEVDHLISTLYTPDEKELAEHIKSQWFSHDRDFFEFYLNLDQSTKRLLLCSQGIKVSPEKYADSTMRSLAILFEKKKTYKVFPIETELLTQFCLMGNNHSLDFLKDLDTTGEALNLVKNSDIDVLGNGRNWCRFWELSDAKQKDLIVDYLLTF